jgi:hypothetical protein
MAVAGVVEWTLVGTVIGAVYRVERAPSATQGRGSGVS